MTNGGCTHGCTNKTADPATRLWSCDHWRERRKLRIPERASLAEVASGPRQWQGCTERAGEHDLADLYACGGCGEEHHPDAHCWPVHPSEQCTAQEACR